VLGFAKLIQLWPLNLDDGKEAIASLITDAAGFSVDLSVPLLESLVNDCLRRFSRYPCGEGFADIEQPQVNGTIGNSFGSNQWLITSRLNAWWSLESTAPQRFWVPQQAPLSASDNPEGSLKTGRTYLPLGPTPPKLQNCGLVQLWIRSL